MSELIHDAHLLDPVPDAVQDGKEARDCPPTAGPARCDAGELGELARQGEGVRCLDADRIGLERAFEQVAATLWGTGRLGGQGAG